MSRWRVGVNSGGTFTDVCMFDEDEGEIAVWKVSSTPEDPSRGITQGVDEGMAEVVPHAPSRGAPISYFGHGTTVATNALIQHRGARVRPDHHGRLPRPARDRPAEAAEPLRHARRQAPDARSPAPALRGAPSAADHDGSIEVAARRGRRSAPPRAGCARRAWNRSRSAFSTRFIDPVHERARAAIVAEEMPERLHLREPRDRAGVPRVRAAVDGGRQRLSRPDHAQLHRAACAARCGELGMQAAPHLTQSNGGVVGFDEAGRSARCRAVLSGPSTGVVGAAGARPRGRLRRHHHLRHGRHDRPTSRWCRAAQPRLATEADRARLPDQGADGRHPHGGRRRRLDRLIDSGGLLKVGPAERRRRSRPGLLRPRRRPSRP